MSTTYQNRRKLRAERARKNDDYWLLWTAAGFVTAAAIHHLIV